MITLNEAAQRLARVHAAIAAAGEHRPRCRGIEPDADEKGYYCTACGYELVTRGAWYVHGTAWRHPR